MTRSSTPYLLPMVVVSVAFFAIPLLLLVVYSFWDGQGFTLDNYQRFFGDDYNFRVVMNTARLGLYTVLGTTLVGLPIALMYYHSGRTVRQTIIFLCLIPMLTSNVVRTFAWIVILGRNGPLNDILVGLGIFETPSSFMFTEIGLVMAMVQIDLPLLVLPLIAVMTQMPRQLADAADASDRVDPGSAAGSDRGLDPGLCQFDIILRYPVRHWGRPQRLCAPAHLS
jgi:putative spermidine/putrescine transport system permease protein